MDHSNDAAPACQFGCETHVAKADLVAVALAREESAPQNKNSNKPKASKPPAPPPPPLGLPPNFSDDNPEQPRQQQPRQQEKNDPGVYGVRDTPRIPLRTERPH